MRDIAVLGGDGVGPEVIAGAVSVIDATGLPLDLTFHEVGLHAFKGTGRSVPPDVMAACKDADAVLFGATSTPPGVPGYKSAILTLRQELELGVNLRPARSVPGLGAQGLDLAIVRENTEGLYAGIEERSNGRAMAQRIITHTASLRTARFAFGHALQVGAPVVTAVHKANILQVTDGLFLEACREAAAEHPPVRLEDALVDSVAARLVLEPARYRVLVTTNLFGDILSDVAAAVMGGLGLAASANVGERHALFEPVHGSAPDIAGQGVANPVGMVRSAALMLRHLGEAKWAERVERAVDASLQDPATRTRDVGGRASTEQATEAIVRGMRE